VDGDGKIDVLTGHASGGFVILRGNGDGTFQSPRTIATGSSGSGGVAIADLNKDGVKDLLFSDLTGNRVDVFLGSGNGAFGTMHTYATDRTPRMGALTDVNGDGNLDVLTANFN